MISTIKKFIKYLFSSYEFTRDTRMSYKDLKVHLNNLFKLEYVGISDPKVYLVEYDEFKNFLNLNLFKLKPSLLKQKDFS